MTPCRPLVCAALTALFVSPAAADGGTLVDLTPHITIEAQASREVAPDVATLRFGVVTERPTATAAAGENARAAADFIAQIMTQGVASAAIRTESFTLESVYDVQRDNNGREIKRTLSHYKATNIVSVRLHDLEKAGALAQQAIDHGANTFNGVRFEAEKEEAIRAELRLEAVRNAQQRAQAYATALGVKLGRVLEIRPPDGGRVADLPMRVRAAGDSAAASVPIPLEPGVLVLEAAPAIVTWELTQ